MSLTMEETLTQNEIDEILAKYGCYDQEIHAKTVLLVDAAKFVRELQKMYLQPKNIEVVGEAGLGIDAIQQYALLRPDLVIVGIHFPDFDGIELISNLLKFDKYAQIMVCSADARKSSIMKAIGVGAIDYLVKPFTQDRLISNLVANK